MASTINVTALEAVSSLASTDRLLLVRTSGSTQTAKSILASAFKGDTGATGATGATGNGIKAITYTASSASGGSNTLTITQTNGTSQTFTIKNGKDGTGSSTGGGADGVGVESVEQTTTSSADGGTNVITVTLTDGTSSTFSVKNGSKGSTGAAGASGQMATSSETAASKQLQPNTLHTWGTVSALTLTLASPATGKAAEYAFQFTASSSGCTLTLPSSVKWAGGTAPTINAGKTYLVTIIGALAAAGEW